jgi:hypothetical protein
MGKFKSDFLVSSPSLVSGAGRLLDWCGQFDEYNASRNGTEADTKAMASDWGMVGDDLRAALAEFETAL